MENDLVRLQHILAVAKQRSFIRAAEQLRISQPALSRSIKLFEERHKVRLFDRGRGGAVPTAAGIQIIREADKILRSLRELKHSVRLYSEQGAGLIRVVLAPMLTEVVLPHLTRLVLNGNKHAMLDAIASSSDDMSAHLHDERNELVFCAVASTFGLSGLTTEAIGTMEFGAIVRQGHPLGQNRPVTVSDIVQFPALCVGDLSDSRIDSKVGGVICSHSSALKDATTNSDGIWIGWPTLAKRELEIGTLRLLQVKDIEFRTVDFCVAYRKGRSLSQLAREMIEAVRIAIR